MIHNNTSQNIFLLNAKSRISLNLGCYVSFAVAVQAPEMGLSPPLLLSTRERLGASLICYVLCTYAHVHERARNSKL